jgi:hypothetical protein
MNAAQTPTAKQPDRFLMNTWRACKRSQRQSRLNSLDHRHHRSHRRGRQLFLHPLVAAKLAAVIANQCPSQVKLSGEEREIARAAGISEVEYAKHKLAMLRKQRSGEIQK